MADTYKQSRIERDLLPDAPQEVNLQQFRVHSRDVIDKNFRPRSINAKNKSFILRDFTNSTLEEIVASQNFDAPRESTDSLLKKSERKLNRAVAKKAKQPTGLHKVFRAESSAESDSQKSSDDEDDDNGNCNSDHESQSSSVLTSLEDTIAVQPTRWDMAEQQFVELFFGQDLILRSRQRHQHILEAIKNHKNSLPKQRPKSPLKNVTFNLKRNLHYDFRPYPEVTVDSSETVASSTAATSTESDDDSNITHENYLTAVLENAKLSDSSRRGIKTAEAEPLRVVRPRTAELSPEMKSRLEKFRELDSFAFIRPDDLHLSRVGSIGSLRNFKAGQMAPRFSIYGGNAENFLKNLLKIFETATRFTKNLHCSTVVTCTQLCPIERHIRIIILKIIRIIFSRLTEIYRNAALKRPASSAHTFNAPACDQVVLQHSFATPKHKRPLSKGVRKFLVDAAIEDSVHPKLGNFSTLQNDTVYEHQNIQSAMVTVPSTENVLTGLHYYLHPPALPAPGLGLVPYDIFSMNPPTQVFKLQIPQKLSKSLQDPRNLVGLEGEKAGGRILMRKINALYDVPKCPKVGGRITPIEKPETPNNDHYYSESIFSSAPSREDTESIFSISTAPSCNPHNSMVAQAAENQKISSKISSPLNNIPPKSPSVNQILQLMVLQNPDIYSSHEKSRKTRQQVQLSFTNNVGRMFPLDYFMDHEEMTILVDRVTEHVNCTKLVDTESQMPKKIHCKGFVSTAIHAEVWHPGFISLYNDIRKEFLVEWDNATPFSYPPKRPINHLLTPDPTHSSRWLTRAEINLESDTLAAHLLKLYTADRIRAEFESRATLLQICGVLAPLLIPGLPEFQKKDTIRVIYAQVGIVQQAVRRSKIRGAKFGDDSS
ncbi:hypothetical protein HK100_006198 [Physocladia obscura]|uniref:Uncharacterized protein n=1 Tax=Physocladia obscura TaxID=109957 RepID=A0AAD5T7V8_9FUNG|nr:hypothetical protein HK100_006198 [Physocladia obscura]